MENFINEQFYDILVNRIKSEIKIALKEDSVLSSKFRNPITNELNPNDNLHVNNNNTLIDALKSEIDFLRNEVASKNKIIELLIKDCNIYKKYQQ